MAKKNYGNPNAYKGNTQDYVNNMIGIKSKPYTGVGSVEFQNATRSATKQNRQYVNTDKWMNTAKELDVAYTTIKKKASAANTQPDTAIKNTPAVSNKPSTHTIAAGETLGGIAKKYGVDWRQLAKDNGIDNPNLIIAGRKLNINGATKQAKPKKRRRRELAVEKPVNPEVARTGFSRTDVVNQLAPVLFDDNRMGNYWTANRMPRFNGPY